MIFGGKTGGDQLVCFQSRSEKKSGTASIAPSVESGPLERAYVSSWEAAAEAVASASYSGTDRLIGDLSIVDLTPYNLRLLFSCHCSDKRHILSHFWKHVTLWHTNFFF